MKIDDVTVNHVVSESGQKTVKKLLKADNPHHFDLMLITVFLLAPFFYHLKFEIFFSNFAHIIQEQDF